MSQPLRVPNFDTLSTIIDRLTVEIVKRSHFEFLIETGSGDPGELRRKVELQDLVVHELRGRLRDFLEQTYVSREYEYVDETRTFK
jgi:hypothetical protein